MKKRWCKNRLGRAKARARVAGRTAEKDEKARKGTLGLDQGNGERGHRHRPVDGIGLEAGHMLVMAMNIDRGDVSVHVRAWQVRLQVRRYLMNLSRT